MDSESSKNSRSYKIAAILFSISGFLFIIVTAVSNNIVFLPAGIALVIISIVFRQQGKKLTNAVNNKED
jgi:energy-coupling factor transporter transmembrane protein EcfT